MVDYFLPWAADDLVDTAFAVEVGLADVVEFAVEQHLEAADGFLDGDVLARRAGEDFGDRERLREEALDLARTVNGELVLGGKLIETEDRDDVLEILVALGRTRCTSQATLVGCSSPTMSGWRAFDTEASGSTAG